MTGYQWLVFNLLTQLPQQRLWRLSQTTTLVIQFVSLSLFREHSYIVGIVCPIIIIILLLLNSHLITRRLIKHHKGECSLAVQD